MLEKATPEERAQQPDEREIALRAISSRWGGDLSAYLDALARLKEAGESSHTTLPEIEFARTVKR